MKSWADLTNAYLESGLVVVLGAGVSKGSNIPTWSKLLQRVITDKLQADLDIHELQSHGMSLPAIASLVEERLSDRNVFVEAIRTALYQEFPFKDDVDKSNRRAYVRHIKEHNSTLRAIAALTAVRKPDGRTYDTNSRIHAIVTFNLDGLLQAYVYARYEKRLLRTIERASASRIPGKISIYHMHGFLRFDEKKGDPGKEAADAAVLTEQDYFNFFNQPTSLFNYTFLHLLREYPCCFVGLSMNDDNIRRLLHYSKLEKFNALQDEGETDPKKYEEKLYPHFAILARSTQSALDDAIQDTLRPLGVNVLWVDDFMEIPDRIGALYRSSGDNWEVVY